MNLLEGLMLMDETGELQNVMMKRNYNITLNAALINESNTHFDMFDLARMVKDQVNKSFNFEKDNIVVRMKFNLKIVKSEDEIRDRDNIIRVVPDNSLNADSHSFLSIKGRTELGGLNTSISEQAALKTSKGEDVRTFAHELGHSAGLGHEFSRNNLMTQSQTLEREGESPSQAATLTPEQIHKIGVLYRENKLNVIIDNH